MTCLDGEMVCGVILCWPGEMTTVPNFKKINPSMNRSDEEIDMSSKAVDSKYL